MSVDKLIKTLALKKSIVYVPAARSTGNSTSNSARCSPSPSVLKLPSTELLIIHALGILSSL